MKFSNSELESMRRFYENELRNTLDKLEHIQTVLAKLGEDKFSIDIQINRKPFSIEASGTDTLDTTTKEAPTKKKVAIAKTKGKKRGPKAIWGNYILKRLRQADKPMTYQEMIDDAIAQFKIAPENHHKMKQAIVNSAFRLRNLQDRIDTFALAGKREKYMGLKKWFDENGNIVPEYKNRVITK